MPWYLLYNSPDRAQRGIKSTIASRILTTDLKDKLLTEYMLVICYKHMAIKKSRNKIKEERGQINGEFYMVAFCCLVSGFHSD